MTNVPTLILVTDVEVIGDRRLRLTFEDGTGGDVSYEGREFKGVLEPLNDPQFFAHVFVDKQLGTISWPGELDLAPERLYEQARENPVPASATG